MRALQFGAPVHSGQATDRDWKGSVVWGPFDLEIPPSVWGRFEVDAEYGQGATTTIQYPSHPTGPSRGNDACELEGAAV